MSDIFFEGSAAEFIQLEGTYATQEINIVHATNQLNETIALMSQPWGGLNEARRWGSTILPTLVASRLALGPQTVVDFGGGAAKQYVEIAKVVGPELAAQLHYHVVETPEFVQLAAPWMAKLFDAEHGKTLFLSDGALPAKADIVSCTSSLHYLPDFKAKLRELLACGPELFLIINTPINDRHTYSRIQNNLAVRIAQWVFGIDDLDREFGAAGYRRVFRARHDLAYPTSDTPEGSETHFSALIYAKA